MGDYALALSAQAFAGGATGLPADLSIVSDDLASDEGLRTSVLLSLFTDRRAEDDDALPTDDGDRRGWWGDQFAEIADDRVGSRLWLLDRSKRLADVAPLAEAYAQEALAWMLEDGVAEKVEVSASIENGILRYTVSVYRPTGTDPIEFRFSHAWEGELGV